MKSYSEIYESPSTQKWKVVDKIGVQRIGHFIHTAKKLYPGLVVYKDRDEEGVYKGVYQKKIVFMIDSIDDWFYSDYTYWEWTTGTALK